MQGRLLELGALTPGNYSSCSSWIDNHPVDLHSRHPDILEQDFFHRPLPTDDGERFDIISCSLVLNFVPEPKDRGRMLNLCREHLHQRSSSLLFLVLPLPCVINSRYLTIESMEAIMSHIGFTKIEERWKSGGKVYYSLWAWKDVDAAKTDTDIIRWQKKVEINPGPKRNNFAALLP